MRESEKSIIRMRVPQWPEWANRLPRNRRRHRPVCVREARHIAFRKYRRHEYVLCGPDRVHGLVIGPDEGPDEYRVRMRGCRAIVPWHAAKMRPAPKGRKFGSTREEAFWERASRAAGFVTDDPDMSHEAVLLRLEQLRGMILTAVGGGAS